MRVLHIHSGNLYGGVETCLLTLAREGRRAPDMSSSFALCFEGRLHRELQACDTAPTMLGAVRLGRPITVWRARRTLTDHLNCNTFDLVVCHQAWPYVIFRPTIRGAGLPSVLWLHTVNDGRDLLDRWACARPPNLVIANSRFTANSVLQRFPTTPIEWLYYPLTIQSRPETDHAGRQDLRRSLNTSPDDIVVVQVGRLESLKGNLEALEALARLRDIPNWRYWVVGGPQRPSDHEYLNRLTVATDRLGLEARVRFVGERSDIPAVLGASDIYCQPNIRPEAFGITLVEALNAGLPVVTSAIGGACEIVNDSCGVLVAPQDVVALAATLRRLIINRDMRVRLGHNAQPRPKALCDPSRQMLRMQQVLSSVFPTSLPATRTGTSYTQTA